MVISELLTRIGFKVDDKPLDNLRENVEGLKHRLTLLAGAEVFRGIYELAERFGDVGEALEANAIAAGVNVEELQKLSYAADQNAVSHEELTGSLSKLTRNLYEARSGTKTAVEAFSQIGITPEQVKSFGDGTDAMRAVSNALARIKDPIKRQAAMMELLGRGSGQMAKFMGIGGAAIDELGVKAERLGIVISGSQVESLAELQDTISTLALQFRGLSAQFAAEFAPSIKYVVSNISEFIAANKEVLALSFRKWVYNLTYAFGYAYGVVEDLAKAFIDFANDHPILVRNVAAVSAAMIAMSAALEGVEVLLGLLFKPMLDFVGILKMTKTVGGSALSTFLAAGGILKNVLVLLLSYLGTLAGSAIPSVGRAIFVMANALNATPFGLIAAAIGAIVLVCHDLWTLWTGGSFEDTWIGKAYGQVMRLYGALKKVMGIKDESALDIEARKMSLVPIVGPGSAVNAPYAYPSAQREAMEARVNYVQENAETVPQATMAASVPSMAMASNAPTNITIDAPMTFTIPENANPDVIAQNVKDGAAEHLAQVMRETQRSVASPMRY